MQYKANFDKYHFSKNTFTLLLRFGTFGGHGSDDVRISRIRNTENRNTEVFSTSSSKFDVVPGVMMDTGLGQHGVILDLTFTQLWCICADDDQLGFSLSKCFQCTSVTKCIFSTLHDESQSRVDAFASLLFDWSHF